VFGPRNIALIRFAAAAISHRVPYRTRSGTSTASLIPASIAEIAGVFYTGGRHKDDRDIDIA
jgi:hypothetical protein